jgi:hypothetical protein
MVARSFEFKSDGKGLSTEKCYTQPFLPEAGANAQDKV